MRSCEYHLVQFQAWVRSVAEQGEVSEFQRVSGKVKRSLLYIGISFVTLGHWWSLGQGDGFKNGLRKV
jgi:hypothetical protein